MSAVSDRSGGREIKWVVTAVVLVLLAAASAGIYFYNNKSKSPTFKEFVAKRGDLLITVQTTGSVQPENRLEIKPPIPGRVDQVLVKEGQRVSKGQILVWMSSTERAVLLDAARSSGSAEVEKWEKLYRPTSVVAPISGMIIRRNVEPGQTFASTDSILVMSDRLTVKAQFDETDIAQVKLKQKAELILDAYPTQKMVGTVDQIAYEAKTVNNVTMYIVDILPDSKTDFMRSGMTANVRVFISTKKDVLLVPSDAVQSKDGASKVLLKSRKGPAIESSVEIGATDGKNVEITNGLAEDDVVLIPEVIMPTKKAGASNPFGPPSIGGRGRR